jgi:putative endonuclease
MYFVYLLQSLKDKTYYIGQTVDLENRLIRHNRGGVSATKNKMPWKLIKYEEYSSGDKARWREYTLKHSAWKRQKFYGV